MHVMVLSEKRTLALYNLNFDIYNWNKILHNKTLTWHSK